MTNLYFHIYNYNITPEINGRKTYPDQITNISDSKKKVQKKKDVRDKIINHYKHQEEKKFIEENGKLKNLRECNNYEDNGKYIKKCYIIPYAKEIPKIFNNAHNKKGHPRFDENKYFIKKWDIIGYILQCIFKIILIIEFQMQE